jgi:hypothetical protein
MTPLKLALALWTRDGIITLVAAAGWPRWAWASLVIDRLEAVAEALREKREARE